MVLDKFGIGVLRKMYHYGYIGGRHTSIDNLQKSFAKHDRGEVKNSVKELIKVGYITPKSTGHGQHCSLNPYMIKEIEELIE